MQNGWTERIEELEAEKRRLMDEIRDFEWKIYRPLKEGEMTQEGDQVLGPEEDAKWEPVAGNYRPAPSPLYPAHCQYRRPIVDEIKKEMEGDYFYRKCVAGKESARSKRIKKLEAENEALKEYRLTESMRNPPEFLPSESVTEEGFYDVSDTAFLYEWWPMILVYRRDGKLWMKHPEKDIEIALSGIKGWYFRKTGEL